MDTTSAKQAERYVPIPKSSQELRAEELLVDGLTFKVVQVGGQVAGDGDAMDEGKLSTIRQARGVYVKRSFPPL